MFRSNISKQIIILAIPIIISQLSRVTMSLADMSMVSILGVKPLAATGMASLLLWVVMSLGIGVRTAVQTVSSRRYGEKKYNECGLALVNGIIISVLFSIPLTIIGYFSSHKISKFFLIDLDAIELCNKYIEIGIFGLLFVLIAFAFQGFYTSIEKTKVHMFVTITSNLLNVYLNAAFIFGSVKIVKYFKQLDIGWVGIFWNWISFPELGVQGAAIATLISQGFMAISYVVYLKKNDIKDFINNKIKCKWKQVYQQIKLGFPVGIQEMFTMFGFSLFYKIIGTIGVLELAGSEVILNIAHASFMPAVGVGMASAALLGKFLGEKDIVKASKTIEYGVKWSFLIMGTMGSIFILFPKHILSLFIIDIEIINISAPCLQMIGFVQYFDAIGLTLFFILTGAGNTKFPALVNIGLCWIVFLPLAYILSLNANMGLIGAWMSFSIWVILFSIIMSLKVKSGSWKSIKV